MIPLPVNGRPTQRLLCIDALRGFDMLWIIGGSNVLMSFAGSSHIAFLSGIEKHFDHTWGQFHFYDLIMPLFLFIVGVVMPISFSSRLTKGESDGEIYRHVIRRVFILYILGLVASGRLLSFDPGQIHLWTDTLHAIAAAYLISSILIIETKIWFQINATVFLLLAYFVIMTVVPVPGHPAGIFDKDLNLALYIDDKVLGHWQEGLGWTYILTNMTFVCTVMLGTFAGRILISGSIPAIKAILLAGIGLLLFIAGKIWGNWFPIIHHLWTSSLVLYAGGISFVLLALFYFVIDILGFKKWSLFFVVIGMNAIAVYVASHLFDFRLVGDVFVSGLSRWLGSWYEFVRSVAALAIIWLILYWMYRNKNFIKV